MTTVPEHQEAGIDEFEAFLDAERHSSEFPPRTPIPSE
jgi:hypothetical protein